MTLGLINANPVVHAKRERVARTEDLHADDAVDPLDIYDILSISHCLFFFLGIFFLLGFCILIDICNTVSSIKLNDGLCFVNFAEICDL